MAENIEQIEVAFSGAIMVAPKGSTPPIGVNGTLPSDTAILGFTDEDGVTITPSSDTNEIAAWPRGTVVYTTNSNGTVEVSFNLYQDSEDTASLWFGGKKNSDGAYVLDASNYGEGFQLYIRTIDLKRGTQKLWVAPSAEVTAREAINLNHTTVQAFGVTITCRYDEGIKGNIARYDGAYTEGS